MGEVLTIVDYGSGNLRSAQKALERAARETGQDTAVLVTGDPQAVAKADRVVLPGVGAFQDCMDGLKALPDMVEALDEVVTRSAKPLLGICVGMQLMAGMGREHGDHPGFGWIPGEVVPFALDDPTMKVPHMGWNALAIDARHAMLDGLGGQVAQAVGSAQGPHAYFVHSYHFVTDDPDHTLARADYGGPFTAIVGSGTVIGTQFHPEKSQALGLALLGNFLRWRP